MDGYRLAYLSESPVNWCPGLGTVLANEEVTADGRTERGNFPVFKRNTAAVDDADHRRTPTGCSTTWTGWTGRSKVKAMQRNWIGRSTGAAVDFRGDRAGEQRRSRCSPPGRTRCSARPSWCWPPSTRWSTR